MDASSFSNLKWVGEVSLGRGLYRLYGHNHQTDEDFIVYVGQGNCVTTRVCFHDCEGKKEFFKFDFLSLPDSTNEELNEAEACEIYRARPRYNRNLPRTNRFKKIGQIAHNLKRPVRDLQDWADAHGLLPLFGLYDSKLFEGVVS
jgi:hypothetical protein